MNKSGRWWVERRVSQTVAGIRALGWAHYMNTEEAKRGEIIK